MTQLLLPALGVGFVVGFRHAFEPDHLAAVTTLATREGGMSQAARLGLAWGVGHTASVALVAVALIVLGIRVPERFYATAELGVATLLIVLGVATLVMESRRHRRALGAPHAHGHPSSHGHAHAPGTAHQHPHDPAPSVRTATRALGFGLVHGLAGSGAVVVLLVAASRDTREQFGYLAAFGIGTVVGMSLVSFLTGTATGVVARRHANAATWVRIAAAAMSTVVGVALGREVLQGMMG